MARNYKEEYKHFHSKPDQKKRRAGRNAARRKLLRTGAVSKGDGKDVHHKDNNTRNNSRSNLSMRSRKSNRSYARTKTGKMKK